VKLAVFAAIGTYPLYSFCIEPLLGSKYNECAVEMWSYNVECGKGVYIFDDSKFGWI
jgi:hypothetical protein